MNEKSNPEKSSIDLLAKLFDVKSASEEETKLFTKISHSDLCKAFEYWIDQSKMMFGEPVLIHQTQSLRDAGVDVSMNLVSSKINFGFQIKSYGDIEESLFSKNVNAQITQSHRHGLKKLVLAFGGDLTNKRQLEKIRGLISELKQQDDDYIIVLPPEKVVTIYKVYVEKKHPLKYVMFEFRDAIKIADALSESLSNEKRDVAVNVSINYKHNIDSEKYKKVAKFTLKLKKDDLDFLDEFEKLHQTGESITLTEDKISRFEIYDGDKVLNSFEKGTLTITPEYRKSLTIRTLSESGDELCKLEKISLVRRQIGNEIHFELDDEKQTVLKLVMMFIPPNEFRMNFDFEFTNSDVEQLQNTIDFIESLRIAKKINFIDEAEGLNDKLDVPNSLSLPKVNELFAKLNKALLIIQNHTELKFKFPEKLTKTEIDDIFKVAHILQNETVKITAMKFNMEKESALKLLNQYKEEKIDNATLGGEQIFNILGNEVRFDNILELTRFKPRGELNELIESSQNSDKDLISIELESIDDSPNTKFQFKKFLKEKQTDES